MAWLERAPSGFFKVAFRIGDNRFKRSLKVKNQARAESLLDRLEENIRLVELGRLEIPAGADVPDFLLSDGKLNGKPKLPRKVSLKKLFAEFEESLPDDSLEPDTLRIAKVHMGHIKSVLGDNQAVDQVTQQHLQRYVSHRSKQIGKRNKKLSPTTIKKELSTFSTVWTWARKQGYVDMPFPKEDLRFPKSTEKPPF